MKDLVVSFPQPCSENWEGMARAGCNRLCAKCDTVIHDLSEMTLDSADTLLRSGAEVCVRARIDGAGVVQLKTGTKPSRRRMIAASIGMFAFASQAATASVGSGTIIGDLSDFEYDRPTSVVAIGPTGKKYRAKMESLRQGVGDYQIKGLPPGTYRLRFVLRCNPREKYEWDGPTVVVADGPVWARQAQNKDIGCAIVVGKIVTKEHRV